MGALAPVSPWLPEDDLLLKNSIEAGASLESLAKGAVQFSRKFTVQELQDRWHSLLYDPVISAEASFRMIEYECSALSLPSKLNRAGNSKESKSLPGKRKAESVRSCYYALRKRIRNEPFNSRDLSFLVASGNDNFFGNGDEPLSGNCILGYPMSNHFGLQESHLDIMHHSFPPIPADGGTSSGDGHIGLGFHRGLDHHPVEDGFAMQQDDIHREIPHIFEEHQSFTGNDCGVVDLGRPKQVPGLFETDHLEANPPSAFGQMDSVPGNVCSNFDGNQVFHSPIPECGVSFPNLEYSSPLPEIPIWRTVEDISSPSITVDDGCREKDLHAGDTFALPDDGDTKDTSTQGCDFVHANSKLKMQMPCDELKCPAGAAEGYLAELSNSLLNFNDEELMTLDDDKGMIDKSFFDGLNLFMNSPNDVNQVHVPSPEQKTSVTPDYITNAVGSCPVESVESVQMPSSASPSDPQFPEPIDGIICCTLNTEDLEIPCNDDVFLPNKSQLLSVSSVSRRNLKETGNSICSSVKDFAGKKKLADGAPVLMQRGQGNPAQSQGLSQMMGSQVIPEKGQLHPVGQCGVKFGLPNSDSQHLGSRKPGIACGGSNQINSTTDIRQPAKLKENNTDVASVKNIGHTLTDFLMEKPTFGSDSYKRHERNASGVKQEFDDLATIQDCHGSNAELESTNIPDSEPDINHPISEPEEPPIESDDDVPYFSDIEAMILDMDLDPDDQDTYEQEVSKYQHEDTRRAIIRLEQGAHSYMQRNIASHRAFAILYGRHSKHYIKKPEVLLGRATEDVVVDIDLGREGRANKISRRQAIINMDKGGAFYLKNLGKCSISVNNKEVAPGRSLSLTSSCLIEIRGMPFIFETNQTCVKRYIDGITTKNQSQEHQI